MRTSARPSSSSWLSALSGRLRNGRIASVAVVFAGAGAASRRWNQRAARARTIASARTARAGQRGGVRAPGSRSTSIVTAPNPMAFACRRARPGRDARRSGDLFQRRDQVGCGLKPCRRRFLQQAPHDGGERRRHVGSLLEHLRRSLVENRVERIDGVLARERALAREHLEEDRAQREQVRSAVDRRRPGSAPARDTRRSPARSRSASKAHRALASSCASLAIPKSRIFVAPARVRKMFSGFRSRCTDPAACAATSPRATSAPIRRTSSTGSAPRSMRARKRLAVEELRHEIRAAVDQSDVVEPDDVGVIERGGHARFLHEALDPLRVPGPGRAPGPSARRRVAAAHRWRGTRRPFRRARASRRCDRGRPWHSRRAAVRPSPAPGRRERRQASRGNRADATHAAASSSASADRSGSFDGELARRRSRSPASAASQALCQSDSRFHRSVVMRATALDSRFDSSRYSQARAVFQSLITVRADTPSASAVSSTLNPPKNLQLDHLAGPGIHRRERVERVVQRNDVDLRSRRGNLHVERHRPPCPCPRLAARRARATSTSTRRIMRAVVEKKWARFCQRTTRQSSSRRYSS